MRITRFQTRRALLSDKDFSDTLHVRYRWYIWPPFFSPDRSNRAIRSASRCYIEDPEGWDSRAVSSRNCETLSSNWPEDNDCDHFKRRCLRQLLLDLVSVRTAACVSSAQQASDTNHTTTLLRLSPPPPLPNTPKGALGPPPPSSSRQVISSSHDLIIISSTGTFRSGGRSSHSGPPAAAASAAAPRPTRHQSLADWQRKRRDQEASVFGGVGSRSAATNTPSVFGRLAAEAQRHQPMADWQQRREGKAVRLPPSRSSTTTKGISLW